MTTQWQNKRVGVLFGGLSAEREISHLSGTAICQTLRERGYAVTPIEVDASGTWIPQVRDTDVVFIALHGRGGERLATIHGISFATRNVTDSDSTNFNTGQLKAELASSRFPPFDLTEIDIEGDPELEAAHGRSIPVLAIGGEIVAKGKVEPRALRRRFERLAAAWHAGRDREGQGNG